ncbi:pentapeptide repeat-containing protein [Chamaesiphon sp. OTE_75_metabat_556]|uniref:pentapeptide repeat-containing protein n=1 Tax=Chamaesiphon sp. OTE_75_metabat_556 TaxID=2964692 RepID=UPI00286D0EFA|nr:pentapeptide repeat-containing protein [Chamaesiphon sp. OTE_75_metabat_556]
MEKPDKHIYRLWGLKLCRLWKKQGFVVLTILLLALLVGIILWNSQQNNVNLLEYKIEIFKEEIAQDLSGSELFKIEDRLKLDKDILVIEKDKITIQNGVYTTLVQALGGLALIINAYLGFCNFKIGEKNLKVAEDKQVTERFSKAIEHLGNEKAIDVRLGGIYALEQIAIDSPEKYHWTIVEILSAFVRGKRQIKELSIAPIDSELDLNEASQESPFNATSQKLEKVGIDIQTALTVMGRRNVKKDPEGKHIDLRKVNLVGVELPNANFSGAILCNAILCDVDFMGANLSNAYLNGVDLCEARLSFANLNDTDLTATLDANNKMVFTNLRDARLLGATFVKAKLSGADFYRAHLCGANFKGAELNNVSNFNTAILGGMKVNNIPLPGANFTGARLSFNPIDENFGGINFEDANLNNTNLSNNFALRNANFGSADLTNTNLIGASLDDADLSQCKNLTQEQLNLALTSENTKLPSYLTTSPAS